MNNYNAFEVLTQPFFTWLIMHFVFLLRKPIIFFFSLTLVSGQLARISTNSTGPEVNNHVSLQWPSYEQPQGSNLRPQREQISWSQIFTTEPPPRWLRKPIIDEVFCYKNFLINIF